MYLLQVLESVRKIAKVPATWNAKLPSAKAHVPVVNAT